MTTPTADIRPGDRVRLTGASWADKGLLDTERHVAGDDHDALHGTPYIVTPNKGVILFIHSAEEHGCVCDYSVTLAETE